MAKKPINNTRVVHASTSNIVLGQAVQVELASQKVNDDWNHSIIEDEAVVVSFFRDQARGAVDAALEQECAEPSSYELLVQKGVELAKEQLVKEIRDLSFRSLGLEYDDSEAKLVGSYQWNDFIRKEVNDNFSKQVKAYVKENPILLTAGELEAIRQKVKADFVSEISAWVKQVMQCGGSSEEVSHHNPLRAFSDVRNQIVFDVFHEVRAMFTKVLGKSLKRKIKADVMKRMFDSHLLKEMKEQGDEQT